MSHEHPASVGTVQERVDYASIVASLAAVDQEVTPDELDAIHDLCRFLDLPPHTTRVVQKFAQEPDHIAVRDALIRLRDSPLRFTLVMDMVSLAYADGRYDLDERRQVRGLAAVMLVSEAEVEQAEDRVRAYNAEVAEEEAVAPVPDSSVETLAQVVAAGVPTATVLALGAAMPELRDEILVQLCKQLTGNPSIASAERAWVLLYLCLCTFHPSEEAENAIELFLQ